VIKFRSGQVWMLHYERAKNLVQRFAFEAVDDIISAKAVKRLDGLDGFFWHSGGGIVGELIK
jgi:hypothetical protein